MKSRPRLKALAYSVSLAVAQLASSSAYADTAVGVDTALGNALNPPGRSSVPRPVADDGYDTVRHSPTGQLYGVPLDTSDEESNKTDGGWQYSGGIEFGVLGGDANKKNAIFRQYKDIKNGPYLNYFEAEGDKPETANFVQAFGGGTGREDQFYGVQFGRYNDWKVKTFYSEMIHVFTDTYKPLYNGTGTGNLTLPAGIPAGSGVTLVTSGTYAVSLTTGQVNAATPAAPTTYGYTASGGGVTTWAGYVGLRTATACTPAAPCFAYNNVLYANAAAAAGINGNGGYLVPGTTSASQPTATTVTYGGVSAAGMNLNTDVTGISKAINNYLATVAPTELSIVRKKGGISTDLRLNDFWKAYAGYTQEKREGARPFGMVLRATGDSSIEIPESIDYTTHDLLAGLLYNDSLNSLNLRVSASLFRNNIGTMTVESPFLQQVVGSVNQASPYLTSGTFDMYPDNDAYNLKGEYARKLPDLYNGRFTATVAIGRNHQNDSLIAPLTGLNALASTQYIMPGGSLGAAGVLPGVVNSGYAIASNTNAATMFNLNNWTTTAALSQQTANATINTKLLDLGLALNPVTSLNVKGNVRYYETDRPNTYTAYNPLTGQYGYFGLDGTLNNLVVSGNGNASTFVTTGSCLSPSGAAITGCTFPGIISVGSIGQGSVSNNLVYSLPKDYKQLNYGLSADYDLNRYSSLNGSWEREDFERRFRERDKTWEDKFKIGYVNRGYELATLRASFETDRKRGGEYNFWPNAVAFPTGLTGLTYDTILTNVYNCSNATYASAHAALCAAYPGNTNLAGYLARYSMDTTKFDQADRDQNILNGRLNFMPRPDIDLGVMVQFKDVKYPASIYGLGKDQQNTLNLDMNYQPSADLTFYGFYSFQEGKKRLVGNAGTGNGGAGSCVMGTGGTTVNGVLLDPTNIWGLCAATADPATSSTTAKFSTNDIWNMDTNDRNNVLGFGFQNNFGKVKLSVDYNYAKSTTKVSYAYNQWVFASAATATANVANINAANAQYAGSSWDDMRFEQNIINVNVLVPLTRLASLRFYDRYELGKVQDWHYDNVMLGASNANGAPTVLLDSGPQNYHANVVGVFLMYKL